MTELFPDYRSAWETENHRLIREHAREFFTREATPHQERWAEQHSVDGCGAGMCLGAMRRCRGNVPVAKDKLAVCEQPAHVVQALFGLVVYLEGV